MARIPKPDPRAVGPVRPSPAPADYSDEVDEAALKKLRALVREDVEEEELEVVDGPAW